MTKKKNIMVDMSMTILHHGHVRLLRKASKLGNVIVALTSDEEVKKSKGYYSELNFKQRKEILSSIKYVHKIIPSKWNISDKFLKKHKIDLLIHGNDYSFKIKKIKTKIFKRTQKISSSLIRKKSYKIYKKLNK